MHSIYEAVRLLGMWNYNHTPGVKKALTNPQKLCKFPWEENQEKPKQDTEQMKSVVNSIHMLMKKNKKFTAKPKQQGNEIKE